MKNKITECLDPTVCREKQERFQNFQSKNLDYGEAVFEQLHKITKLIKTSHFKKRSFERSYSDLQILDIIKNGFVLETHKEGRHITRLLIFSNLKYGKGKYRPVHLVVVVDTVENKASLITAYSPESEAFRWENDLMKRKCFC